MVALVGTSCNDDGSSSSSTVAATAPSSAAPTESSTASAATTPGADPEQADAIMKIVQDYMDEAHLRAVLVRVSVDGKDLVAPRSASR